MDPRTSERWRTTPFSASFVVSRIVGTGCPPLNAQPGSIVIQTHVFFFFQAEDGIRDVAVTGVQTCALPIYSPSVLDAVEEYAAHLLRNGGGNLHVLGHGGEHERRRLLGSDELPLEIHDERRGEPEVVLQGRDAAVENGHVEGLAGHGDAWSKPRTSSRRACMQPLVATLRERAATPDGGDSSRRSAPRAQGFFARRNRPPARGLRRRMRARSPRPGCRGTRRSVKQRSSVHCPGAGRHRSSYCRCRASPACPGNAARCS